MTDLRRPPGDNTSGDCDRVYVIDDNSDMRKSLHYLLGVMEITAWSFASAADFLDQLPVLAPAPILLDIRMPGIDGFGLLDMLAARDVDWPVAVMSAHGDIPIAVRAMKLGVMEFLEKPFDADELERTLTMMFARLSEGEQVSRDRRQAKALLERLSTRETEVMFAVMSGLANKIVAHRLSLSTRTVEMHRANALTKLGVKSVAQVIAIATSAGLDIPAGPKG